MSNADDRFCAKCGELCVRKNTLRNYNTVTGDRQYQNTYRCPRLHWWNIFSGHDWYSVWSL
jgi:hypothetical protein